ncbi:PAQR family membrane homeostasis protein TrhA [Evansella clarkii]|jgi:hemolysin III|uniref:PAQR family membrane homeostasis protein TrhA n=1 Tax=Evansella clarkii TaxID=79879 RepID=UPI000996B03A|nr:hemolysin III family protein [Evansella clarkii]
MDAYIREPINGLTHLFGAIMAFVGLLAMVIKVAEGGFTFLELFAVIAFGVSMILLYSASATYHMVIAKEKTIAFLRRVDHSMIFLLIAGTYTPFCLISLNGPVGWILFGFVAVLAVAGVVFKLIWFRAPRWLSTLLYIGMGWIIIFAVIPLLNSLGPQGVFLLILGGVIYTIGGVIYALEPKFVTTKRLGFHEIFHLFILAGSLAHFLSVYLYVL